MTSRLVVVGLALLAACASPLPPSPKPPAPRAATSAIAEPAVRIAPPKEMPARYLRSLEYDPGGYDASPSAEGSRVAGVPTDLLLGDLLYHSPRTLGEKARAMGVSCNTCHPNGAAHTTMAIEGISDRPGNVDLSSAFFRKASDDGVANPVSVPSLRGCRYTGPYGHDGRTASLAEFVQGVISTEFDGPTLPRTELAALVRYIQDFDFLPNEKIDARGNLTTRASEAARRGEALFAAPRASMFGMSCASCHPATSFFRDGRVHRIGSGAPPSPHAVDGGYETPTLLGLAETAPYFHDGRFATIAEVVGWFDTSFALGLDARGRADLTAYVDAIGAVDRKTDARPLARRLDETFAYVSLLGSSPSRDVWLAVLDVVIDALASPPASLAKRTAAVRERLSSIRARVASGEPLAPSVSEASDLRVLLSRLAADWAGTTSE